MKFDWQHWALIAAAVITGVGPDLVTSLNGVGLPVAANAVSHAVALIVFALGLLKQFAPATQVKP